jgi:hypothetical protein
VEKRYTWCEGIELDTGEMLFLRGNLCRVNPKSARGMKEDLKTM